MPTLEFTEPKIDESINRLNYRWPDMDLLVVADRITDAGFAELWFYHSNGTGNKLLHTAKVNLLSTGTMTQVSKRMAEHSADIPWREILTKIAAKTMEYQRRGEPGVVLQPSDVTAHRPSYLIEPLIMRGVPNIVFGDKGVNKTILSLAALGIAQVGSDDSPSGLAAVKPVKIAILDWESNQDLTDFNLARLIEAGTIPYCEPNYLRCKASLPDEIDRVANFLHDCGAELILIDSLGQAAGSDKFDSSGKACALRMFESLRQLNTTSLIIAQNAKSSNEDGGRRSIFGSTYFTYYARNIFELKRVRDSINKDENHIALIHQESNYSKLYDPIGFHLTFTSTSILIQSELVTMAQLKDKIEDTAAVMDFLRMARKLCSAHEIADAISKSENRTRVVLSNLKRKGRLVNPSTGMWGLSVEE